MSCWERVVAHVMLSSCLPVDCPTPHPGLPNPALLFVLSCTNCCCCVSHPWMHSQQARSGLGALEWVTIPPSFTFYLFPYACGVSVNLIVRMWDRAPLYIHDAATTFHPSVPYVYTLYLPYTTCISYVCMYENFIPHVCHHHS